MPLLFQGVEGYSVAAAQILIASLWQGILLAVVVALGIRLCPRLTPAVRSMLWTAVFLILLGLHAAPLLQQHLPAGRAIHSFGHVSPVLRMEARWTLPLLAFWATLSIARLTQLAHGAIALRRVVRQAVPLPDGPAHAALLQAGGRNAVLCCSTQVDRPSVAGFFPPRILIPADLLPALSEAVLQQIILHEMEHLRRRDDWVNLLQKLALALFPLNPGMWWVERRLCLERELACDDGVLRVTGARKAYAACLAALAEHRLVRGGVALALGAWGRPSELSQRVLRLLSGPLVTRTRYMTASASLLVFVAAGGAVVLAHSPQLVSFTSAPAVSLNAANSVQNGTSAPWTATVSGKVLPVAAQGASGARMIPAVAHMPAKRLPVVSSVVAGTPSRSAVLRRSVRQPVSRRIVARSRGSVPHMLLTDAPVRAGQPNRVAFSASQNLVMYAAVPTPDGWLILQL